MVRVGHTHDRAILVGLQSRVFRSSTIAKQLLQYIRLTSEDAPMDLKAHTTREDMVIFGYKNNVAVAEPIVVVAGQKIFYDSPADTSDIISTRRIVGLGRLLGHDRCTVHEHGNSQQCGVRFDLTWTEGTATAATAAAVMLQSLWEELYE